MKAQIMKRALALTCCALGLVTLMSPSPAFAGYSWCNRGADWPGAWLYTHPSCRLSDPDRGDNDDGTPPGSCFGDCTHYRTIADSPDQCYDNSTIKCQTCEWNTTSTFWDQVQTGTCFQDLQDGNDYYHHHCYCIKLTGWSDIRPGRMSDPVKRCNTLNPCL